MKKSGKQVYVKGHTRSGYKVRAYLRYYGTQNVKRKLFGKRLPSKSKRDLVSMTSGVTRLTKVRRHIKLGNQGRLYLSTKGNPNEVLKRTNNTIDRFNKIFKLNFPKRTKPFPKSIDRNTGLVYDLDKKTGKFNVKYRGGGNNMN